MIKEESIRGAGVTPPSQSPRAMEVGGQALEAIPNGIRLYCHPKVFPKAFPTKGKSKLPCLLSAPSLSPISHDDPTLA